MYVERLQLITLASRRQSIFARLHVLEDKEAIWLREHGESGLPSSQEYLCFLDRRAADRIHNSPGDTEITRIWWRGRRLP
jgi:hypothetical protein